MIIVAAHGNEYQGWCDVSESMRCVGQALSTDATLLARVASPADAVIARAIARALRDPERVARLVEGLVDDPAPAPAPRAAEPRQEVA